jgi:type I restriction enzyme S subunit
MSSTSTTPTVKLGDYLTVLTDYHANGSYERLRENVTLLNDPDYAVMIRTTNFEKEDFDRDLKYITQAAYHFLAKSRVNPGDILMNKIASPGSVYRMPDLRRPVSLAMNLFLLRTDPARLDQDYAYYWLKLNEPYVKSFACGAATATITKNAVRALEIPLPSLHTQRRIAEVLSAYDLLILNDQRRVRLLQEVARSIYHEWFIRFRWDAREYSQCGKYSRRNLPPGWQVRKVTECVDFVRGIEPGSRTYSNAPAPDRIKFLRVGDLSKRDSDTYIPTELANGKILERFDIAVTFDGSVGLVRVGLRGAYSTGVCKIVVRDEARIGWSFAYHLMQSDDIQATIQAHAKGTTIKHAGSAITALEFVSATPDVIGRFEQTTAPILRKILNIEDKIRNLRCTRDLLMSGLISNKVKLLTN